MAKGKHSEFERVPLPDWFSPSGEKMWLLLYKEKSRIKVTGYNIDMRVTEVQSRRGTNQSFGGAHVVIDVSAQPGTAKSTGDEDQ